MRKDLRLMQDSIPHHAQRGGCHVPRQIHQAQGRSARSDSSSTRKWCKITYMNVPEDHIHHLQIMYPKVNVHHPQESRCLDHIHPSSTRCKRKYPSPTRIWCKIRFITHKKVVKNLTHQIFAATLHITLYNPSSAPSRWLI